MGTARRVRVSCSAPLWLVLFLLGKAQHCPQTHHQSLTSTRPQRARSSLVFQIDAHIFEPQGISVLDAEASFITNDLLGSALTKSFSGKKVLQTPLRSSGVRWRGKDADPSRTSQGLVEANQGVPGLQGTHLNCHLSLWSLESAGECCHWPSRGGWGLQCRGGQGGKPVYKLTLPSAWGTQGQQLLSLFER